MCYTHLDPLWLGLEGGEGGPELGAPPSNPSCSGHGSSIGEVITQQAVDVGELSSQLLLPGERNNRGLVVWDCARKEQDWS